MAFHIRFYTPIGSLNLVVPLLNLLARVIEAPVCLSPQLALEKPRLLDAYVKHEAVGILLSPCVSSFIFPSPFWIRRKGLETNLQKSFLFCKPL